MNHQIRVALANIMVPVFQLNHLLAFVSDFGESQADLQGAVIHIFGKSRTQSLEDVDIGEKSIRVNSTGFHVNDQMHVIPVL
jgi:hypothetical protein